MRFVDTNIFLRYLTRADAETDRAKAEACFALLQRVKAGTEQITTTETIVAEVCYVLASPRQYHLTHPEIRNRLRPILLLPGCKLPHRRQVLRALDLCSTHPFLDFEDALAIAHLERLGLTELYSYDTDFDHIPDITRVEP